jgi:hypothetical protein
MPERCAINRTGDGGRGIFSAAWRVSAAWRRCGLATVRRRAAVEVPALIVTMGQASRRLAQERFDVRRINSRIMEILRIAPVPAG